MNDLCITFQIENLGCYESNTKLFFPIDLSRVSTKITPMQIQIHNTQSNTKNLRECPKISTEEIKDKNVRQALCIDYPNVTSGIRELNAKTHIK